MENCLVTGGAGFLGSHICERLIKEGHMVTCFDNYLTGSARNVEHLLTNSCFKLVEGCVRKDLPNEKFTEIWNLASPASPPQYQADPIGTMMINVQGMYNVLEHALNDGARVFQASTSEVYGDPEVHPQIEEYKGSVNPIGPRACYDEGKRAAETLCVGYRETRNLDVRIVRIFNTYGPRMDPMDGRVVSNFIVNALEGKPLKIYGGGQQTRSFCYRDDLVNGFFKLMRNENGINGPINIGNPREFTIRQLAELVLEMTNSKSALVDSPMPTDDPKQRCPDITRAKKQLGWEPEVELREGLQHTINFFANHLNLAAT